MRELLPIVIGLIIGAAVGLVPGRRLRRVLLPLLALAGGATASAINGELSEGSWALFVSFDALLVWVCAFIACGATRRCTVRRGREPALPPA